MISQSMQLQAKAAPSQIRSFTPVRTSLLQRKCACGGTPGVDGECAECHRKRLALQRRSTNQPGLSTVPPIVHDVLRSPGQALDSGTRAFMEPRFGHDFSQVRVHAVAPTTAQTALTVSPSGDPYEREADRVADGVMRMPQSVAARGSESGLRYDFSEVRIHTGTRAAESAQSLNALAYTVGREIVFGAGQYTPSTAAGRRLLAHELTHVIQGNSGASPGFIRRATIYADGYPHYPSPAQEVAAIQGKYWQPTSEDFRFVAGFAGKGIERFSRFLGWIKIQDPGNIKELNLIGHSNPDLFGFAGKVDFRTGSVELEVPSGLSIDNLEKFADEINHLKLRNRFAKGAKITLFSCHSGTDFEFLQQIADTFGVCTYGFSKEILYCYPKYRDNKVQSDTRGEVAIGACPGQKGLEGLKKLKPDRSRCPKGIKP